MNARKCWYINNLIIKKKKVFFLIINKYFRLFKGEDAMIALKKNRGKELFRIVIVYGILFFILSFVNAILLYFVKDANKYGIKVKLNIIYLGK